MNQIIRKTVLILGLGLSGVCAASAGVQVGFSAGDRGLNNFYISLGNYYGFPQGQIVSLRDNRVSNDEMAVVLAIARGARVNPLQIVRLHQRGYSWFAISNRLGLGPDVLCLPAQSYGRVSNDRPYNRRGFNYSDREVVNFINNRFHSDNDRFSQKRDENQPRVEARVPDHVRDRFDDNRDSRKDWNDHDARENSDNRFDHGSDREDRQR